MTAEDDLDIRAALTRLQSVWGQMPYGGMAHMPYVTGDPRRESTVDKANRLVAGFESLRDVLVGVAAQAGLDRAELDTAREHRRNVHDALRYFTAEQD